VTLQFNGGARTPGPLGRFPGGVGGRVPGPIGRTLWDEQTTSPTPGAVAKALKSPDASLQTPNAQVVSQLNNMLKAALKQNDPSAMDGVLKKIVDAYRIGQDGVTILVFDPKQSTAGYTRDGSIAIGKDGLGSPAEAASTILHESNHARRNKELADSGIDRGKLGISAEAIYSALSEIEGYQLEIDNAKKLETSVKWVKGAQNEKKTNLHELEMPSGGKGFKDLAEKGRFDEAFKKFRDDVLKKK
jgi:hypothetical protein